MTDSREDLKKLIICRVDEANFIQTEIRWSWKEGHSYLTITAERRGYFGQSPVLPADTPEQAVSLAMARASNALDQAIHAGNRL